ncbi:DUF2723 domain-containing protein [candidate division KSB1 bacterium]|nr:DUF2723 domain-containing protein [candidate division KSB1 bacterium]
MGKLKSFFTRDPELSLVGAFTFLLSLGVYLDTIAPTVSFWDCGEFIASSYILGVPHPPGAPFFLLLGRLFTFLPFPEDIGLKVNIISVIASALTILLLYLIIIQLVRSFRGRPENRFDKFIIYGAASIGALTYAFSDTFWFNAVEAEVYALSTLFTAATLWLALRWFETREDLSSVKNLLLIVYLIGLSYGVHLLNLLVIPTVILIIFFNKPQIILNKLLAPLSAIVAAFLTVVIIGIEYLSSVDPTVFLGISGTITIFGLFFVVAVGAGFLILQYRPNTPLHWQSLLTGMFITTAMIFVIVAIGRSTYFMISIRSAMEPLINENDPSSLGMLYYLNREQYGTTSLLSTTFDRAAPFWDYQIKYMYLRYFSWNFIGKGLTFDGGGRGFILESFSFIGLKGLPFLVGMIGLFYHSVKDWKKSFAIFAFFFTGGLLLVIYLNQANPQPRERDYVYVGSFFVFAIWIGLGAMAILSKIKQIFSDGTFQKTVTGFIAVVLVMAGPWNQFNHNYDSHDRTGNYVPWDYSYNILMSCEPNAIIFTNGDNDTFPLWYLQEVEGIRKDVKIVNLSLLNTTWYVNQLKNYEPKLNIALTDAQISQLGPVAWESQVITIPVPRSVYEAHFQEYGQTVPPQYDTVNSISVQANHTIQVGDQTALKVQDLMIYHLISNNQWQRPVYFAITVSPAFYAGFDKYFRLDGLAWRITPVENAPLLQDKLGKNLMEVFQYRGLNDPDVYLDFGTLRLLYNYRQGFLRFAQQYLNSGNQTEAIRVLDSMQENVPDFRMIKDQVLLDNIGRFYSVAGKQEEYHTRILDMLDWEPPISPDIQHNYAVLLFSTFSDTVNAEKAYRQLWERNNRDNRAFSALISIYEVTRQYDKAAEYLEQWIEIFPTDTSALAKLQEMRSK